MSDRWEYAEQEFLRVLNEGYQDCEWSLDVLVKKGLKLVKLGIEEALPEGHEILLADEPLNGDVDRRPDLVLRTREGLVVWDTKVTMRLDTRYESKRIQDYDTDWQLWDYAWHIWERYGSPVTWTGVLLLIAEPHARALRIPIRVTPRRLDHWIDGAVAAWEDRERCEVLGLTPPRWTECNGKFGRCIYYDLCHIVGEENAGALYQRLPPREPISTCQA